MKQRLTKRGRDGFTLVEAMIASAVLAMFVTGFVISFITAMRAMMTASNHYRATAMARNRLQRVRSTDFDTVFEFEEVDSRVDEHGIADASGRFRRTTIISTNSPAVDELMQPYILEVSVQVRYPVATSTNLSSPIVVNGLVSTRM